MSQILGCQWISIFLSPDTLNLETRLARLGGNYFPFETFVLPSQQADVATG